MILYSYREFIKCFNHQKRPNMSVSAFSADYYQKLPTNMPTTYVIRGKWLVPAYANVTPEGTLSLEPKKSGFLERLKKYFTFKQNPYLSHVDKRLCEIVDIVKNPSSPEYHNLYKEVRSHRFDGTTNLVNNLNSLAQIMRWSNLKSEHHSPTLRIVNLVRSFFGKAPITFFRYNFPEALKQNHEAWNAFINSASALTPAEQKEAKSALEISDRSGLDETKCSLTPESVYMIQRSSRYYDLGFKVLDHHFHLRYNRHEKKFVLWSSGAHEIDKDPSQQKEYQKLCKYLVDVTFQTGNESKTQQLKAEWLDTKESIPFSKPHIHSAFRSATNVTLPYDTTIQISIPEKSEKPFCFLLKQAQETLFMAPGGWVEAPLKIHLT